MIVREPSSPAPAGELEDLRARLAEAQEALRAIRAGNVDAVLVTGEHGDQVYTLRGADRIYRQLVETMSEGAVLVSEDGFILYGNVRFAEMLGQPLERVIGTALGSHLPRAAEHTLTDALVQARTEPSRRQISLVAADGRLVRVLLAASRFDGGAEAEGASGKLLFCLVLTDLTEQIRHAAVVADEGLARLILEQAAQPIIVCDAQGHVIRLSEPARRLCDDAPLAPFAELFPLRTQAADPFRLAPVLLGESVMNADVTLERKGRKTELILNAGPLRSGREILGCVVTLTDITERRYAEAAARESDERARAIFEQAAVGIAEVALDGSWLVVNQRLCDIVGFSREELLGLKFQDITHPDDLARDVHNQRRLVAGEIRTYSAEKRYIRKDRSSVWINVTVGIGHEKPESPGHFITVVEDITARRRAEAERERLTMAMEQATEMVLIADVHGDIVYVNPAFEVVTGFSRADAIGQNPRLLKSGMQDEAFYQRLWGTIRGGATWRGRTVNKKKDGTLFTEDASISPVRDAAGVVTSYVKVAHDITATLALEAQFLQSQKMEGIGRLAGGVAHDFNNLLSVMLSYTGFAIAGLREGDPLRDDLAEVTKAGERAAALTRQLLAFSRKQVLQPEPLDLDRILADMEPMLHRLISEDVSIVRIPQPRLGLVRADRGQIEQVIMNLVVNARDAMPRGGKLTIETANLELDEGFTATHPALAPGRYVMVAVSDSGSGMDEETKARVFEPFFTTKALGKGTGLGLSTVHGIVHQSGGSVFVYSELGQGTTFKVYLPCDLPDAAAPTVAKPPTVRSMATGTETALVVEDEEALREVARRMIEAAGYTVLTAANGEEALLVSARHDGGVHLLVTDVVMPRMGGKALALELAKTRPALKVLYMSGYADDAIVHHGVLEPGTHFLAKPFTAADLTRKIREVLDG